MSIHIYVKGVVQNNFLEIILLYKYLYNKNSVKYLKFLSIDLCYFHQILAEPGTICAQPTKGVQRK